MLDDTPSQAHLKAVHSTPVSNRSGALQSSSR